MAETSSDKARLVENQHYDETVSIYDDEEVASTFTPSPRAAPNPDAKQRMTENDVHKIAMNVDAFSNAYMSRFSKSENKAFQNWLGALGQMKEPLMGSDDDNEFEHDDEDFNRTSESKKSSEVQQRQPSKPQQGAINSRPRPPGGHVIEASDDDDDDDDQSDSTEDEDEKVNDTVEGIYDPADYEHLPVSQEIKELFQYITRYTPQAIDLDYKLKPFIPDYIPAVGDIDAFLKVTRPDGKPETLGLQILDEPSAKQSDPTVLDLQLRSISKQTSAKQVVVRSIEEPEKNPKAIDNWITSISDLHRQKPPQNVHYTKNMPDIETLMQEWPPEFEEMLKNINLPSADLDCELTEYIDIICSVLDIPIYKNRIQSLHVLFTLYSEFKNSQHFNQLAHDNLLSNELKHSQPLTNHKSMTHNDGESLSFE